MPDEIRKTVTSGIALAPRPKTTWLGDTKDQLETKVIRSVEPKVLHKPTANPVQSRFAEAQKAELRSRINNLAQSSAQEIAETRKLGRLQPLVGLLGPTEIIDEVNAKLARVFRSKLTVDTNVSNTIIDKVLDRTTRHTYLTLRDAAGKVVDQVVALTEQSAPRVGNREHLQNEKRPRFIEAVRELVSRIKRS